MLAHWCTYVCMCMCACLCVCECVYVCVTADNCRLEVQKLRKVILRAKGVGLKTA